MPRRKRNSTPKIKPWPGSAFALKIKREPAVLGNRHLWVYLERRAPGRYGRLEVMHAIIPTLKHLKWIDKFFASANYRDNLWRMALRVMEEAGVPDTQKEEFLLAINKEYPKPTVEELFLGQLEHPWIKESLGKRKNELSYFKTGVPTVTAEDKVLLQQCFKEKLDRIKNKPGGSQKVIDFIRGEPLESEL